jgi:hypothetical protein
LPWGQKGKQRKNTKKKATKALDN